MQVAADLGAVGAHLDAVRAQHRGGPDAGQHQQLRRVDRAAREQHFARGVHELGAAPRRSYSTPTARVPSSTTRARTRAGDDREVRALARGREVARGGAPARAVLLRDLVPADAGLRRAVEVGVVAMARLARGVEEHLRQRVVVPQVRDVEVAARAVQRVGAALLVLAAAEVRQHVAPRPAAGAHRRPTRRSRARGRGCSTSR